MEVPISISPWLKVDPETWRIFMQPQYLIDYPSGSAIYEQGQSIEHVYIVKSGRVMMRATNADGKEIILMFADKGALFGELGLLMNTNEPFAAIALVDCKLYRVPAQVFQEKLENDPSINRAVMTILARKAYLHTNQVLGLSFGDIRYRIAGVLTYLASMYGTHTPQGILIDLPFTHQDMADLVKSSRVTVSKVLHSFIDSGIITRQKGRYIITNLEHLHNITQII